MFVNLLTGFGKMALALEFENQVTQRAGAGASGTKNSQKIHQIQGEKYSANSGKKWYRLSKPFFSIYELCIWLIAKLMFLQKAKLGNDEMINFIEN